MEKLDAQIVEWMNRYRATADTWVLPPKPAMYLRLVSQRFNAVGVKTDPLRYRRRRSTTTRLARRARTA